MIRALACLFLVALAGAQGGGVQQPRSGLIFSDRNTYSGCYQASVREGWRCIDGARPQLWMLMPLVEPLPPPQPHIWTQSIDLIAVEVPAIHKHFSRAAIAKYCAERYKTPEFRDKICPNDFANIWTCADKSRVLLTDEAGKRHCVKFGGTQ